MSAASAAASVTATASGRSRRSGGSHASRTLSAINATSPRYTGLSVTRATVTAAIDQTSQARGSRPVRIAAVAVPAGAGVAVEPGAAAGRGAAAVTVTDPDADGRRLSGSRARPVPRRPWPLQADPGPRRRTASEAASRCAGLRRQ